MISQVRFSILGVVGAAVAFATGCNTGLVPLPTTTPSSAASLATLITSPSSLQFQLDQNAPQSVSVTNPTGGISALSTSITNPMLIGILSTTENNGAATVSIIPIAGESSATVSFTDQTGATGSVAVGTALCGRPDNLNGSSQMIYPKPGAAQVPTSIGTLYFAVFSVVSPPPNSVNLHLIVGQHATLEGGTLHIAAPPPGSATPATIPNKTLTYMSATVGMLPPATTIGTQIYDDTCQPAVLTGSFST